MNTQISEDDDWIRSISLVSGRECPDASFGFSIPNPIKIVTGAVKGAGKAITNPVKAVQGIGRSVKRTSSKIESTLSKVPVAGSMLAAGYRVGSGAGVIEFAADVASGKNVSKSALDNVKKQVGAYSDLAPIIALIPGVGPALTGAIATADAISKGKAIDKVAIDAVRSQIPAGVPRSAFDVGMATAQGKTPSLSALKLNVVNVPLFTVGLKAGKDYISGKSKNDDAYINARNMLPSAARTALDKGVAVGLGQVLQAEHKKGAPGLVPILGAAGKEEIGKNPLFSVANLNLSGKTDVQNGMAVAVGLTKLQAVPAAVKAIRDSLTGDEKKGFDLGAAVKIGQAVKPLPANTPAKAKLGAYVAEGVKGAKQNNKVAILKTVADDKEVMGGIAKVVKDTKNKDSFLIWLKKILGIK